MLSSNPPLVVLCRDSEPASAFFVAVAKKVDAPQQNAYRVSQHRSDILLHTFLWWLLAGVLNPGFFVSALAGSAPGTFRVRRFR
jgi:phosphopantetheinyl transferase